MNFKTISALCLAFLVPNSLERNLQATQEQNYNQFGNVDDQQPNQTSDPDNHPDPQRLVDAARNNGNELAESILSQPQIQDQRIQINTRTQEQWKKQLDKIFENQNYFRKYNIDLNEHPEAEQNSSDSTQAHPHGQDELSSQNNDEWGSPSKSGSQTKQDEESSNPVGQPEAPKDELGSPSKSGQDEESSNPVGQPEAPKDELGSPSKSGSQTKQDEEISNHKDVKQTGGQPEAPSSLFHN